MYSLHEWYVVLLLAVCAGFGWTVGTWLGAIVVGAVGRK